MKIDVARERIGEKLSSDCYTEWAQFLDNASPGPYAINDIDVSVEKNDIWVEMHEQTFKFNKATFDFNLRLGGSSDEDGYDADFSKVVSGEGKFQFIKDSQDLEITEFSINEDLDLYD